VTRITTTTHHTDLPPDHPPTRMHPSVAPRPSRPSSGLKLRERIPFASEGVERVAASSADWGVCCSLENVGAKPVSAGTALVNRIVQSARA